MGRPQRFCRRSGLMLESMRLLNRPRDIKQYVTIF